MHKKLQKKLKLLLQSCKAAKVNGAGIVFASETIDYGTIAHNSNGKRNLFLQTTELNH
jgi:hypothetical protein